jgi:hypothetical protein
MLEKGKIYKVKHGVIGDDVSLQAAVAKEGWLWLCTGACVKTNLEPLLTSVATGAKCWFKEEELEAADNGEG